MRARESMYSDIFYRMVEIFNFKLSFKFPCSRCQGSEIPVTKGSLNYELVTGLMCKKYKVKTFLCSLKFTFFYFQYYKNKISNLLEAQAPPLTSATEVIR